VTFLIDKINFHHLHPEVDGGISLEKFMQTRHETLNVEKGYVIIIGRMLEAIHFNFSKITL
jgi:hypothetical protein